MSMPRYVLYCFNSSGVVFCKFCKKQRFIFPAEIGNFTLKTHGKQGREGGGGRLASLAVGLCLSVVKNVGVHT